MRKTIFEILKEKDFNIEEEILKLEGIFKSELYSYNVNLEDYAQKSFQSWKHRGMMFSVKELRKNLDLEHLVNIKRKLPLNEDDLFNYIEFLANMLYLARKYLEKGRVISDVTNEAFQKTNLILENIDIISQKFGYKLRFEDEMTFLVKISQEATAVAQNYEDIAPDVMEYKRRSLDGNLKRKRELLNHLSNKYEEIENNLKSNCQTELWTDISFMLNNLKIRHGNLKNNEIVNEYSEKELEKYYDVCYDCLLLAFMKNKYLDVKKEIKDLRKKLKTVKES